jgi:hypothetical protein
MSTLAAVPIAARRTLAVTAAAVTAAEVWAATDTC